LIYLSDFLRFTLFFFSTLLKQAFKRGGRGKKQPKTSPKTNEKTEKKETENRTENPKNKVRKQA
jgi:hypothetical protein